MDSTELHRQIIESVKTHADKWHREDKKIFDFDEKIESEAEYYAIKLLHHNYLIWHYIDLYKSPDSNQVLFVYDKGLEHNKYRNDTIEKLDEVLCKFQKETGKLNTETVGSAIDRLGIHYIKFLHLNDERAKEVKQQFETLSECIKELMQDMESGNRRCMVFSRFKIDYSQ